jgi:SAM-dependent methyltransferase
VRAPLTIEYYDRNGALFFAGSVSADMSVDRARFLKYVPAGGAILDGGCGSGRDTLAFKNAGYSVVAIDGSAEMVRRATAHTDLAVQHLHFDQIEWRDRFDGIWTCASLLHVPRADLPAALSRFARALRPGGVWYMSFKYGETERTSDGGRHFTDMTEPLLTAAIEQTGLSLLEMWSSTDVRTSHADQRWLSALCRRLC